MSRESLATQKTLSRAEQECPLKFSILVFAFLILTLTTRLAAAQSGPLVTLEAIRLTDEPWSDFQGANTDFKKPDAARASPDKALGLLIKLRAPEPGGYLSLLCRWSRNGTRIGNVNEAETKDFYMPGVSVRACEIAPDPVWKDLGEYKVEVQIGGVVVASRTINVSN